MSSKTLIRWILILLCTGLAGCAMSRSQVHLAAAAVASTDGVPHGRMVVIRRVVDERQFEQAPSDPSIPSLGKGGLEKSSADIRARAIARKRSGFGKAMGDVLLEPGQSVDQVVRQSLVQVLDQAGYRVVEPAQAGPDALIVDVHIRKFWAWFQPGFWAITLHADVETELDLPGRDAPLRVAGHAERHGGVATEGAWIDVIDKGLDDYRRQLGQGVAALR